MKTPVVYIIGSGNLAWHLSGGLTAAGIPLQGIVARNAPEGRRLAKKSGTHYYPSVHTIKEENALFFCCVSDDAIGEIINTLPINKSIIVHCSGMHPLPLKTATNDTRRFGVFYPVQSFNKRLQVDWKQIPVCIEAGDAATERLLASLAKKVAGKVYKINSATRAYVHLAAVFANNFGNAQFAIAQEVLHLKGVGFDILRPLILQTSAKVQHSLPDSVQTGPALRNDLRTIRAHKNLLKEAPELGKIYADLTRFIQHHFKNP